MAKPNAEQRAAATATARAQDLAVVHARVKRIAAAAETCAEHEREDYEATLRIEREALKRAVDVFLAAAQEHGDTL